MADQTPSLFVNAQLARARNGDVAARDQLFASCRSYLKLLAHGNVGGRLQAKIDASDLVQQTLLDAYRDFARFQGRTDQEWLAWLRQILNHNLCDAARRFAASGKRDLQREIPLGNPADSVAPGIDPASPGDSPSQIAIHNENELILAAALEQLPQDYREVILLRNIQRLPFEKVAESLDRSRPAAQMLWKRAIEKLAVLMDESRRSIGGDCSR